MQRSDSKCRCPHVHNSPHPSWQKSPTDSPDCSTSSWESDAWWNQVYHDRGERKCVVRQILHRHIVCRRLEGQAYHVPSFHVEVWRDLPLGEGSLLEWCRTMGKVSRLLSSWYSPLSATMMSSTICQVWESRGFSTFPRLHGGRDLVERLIGPMKCCLCKIIGQARLSYDELLTILVEVEAVINSQPLSCVSMDDFDEPLTPSHLLTGRWILSLPDRFCHEDKEEAIGTGCNLLTKRACYVNNTINAFWTTGGRSISLSW